MGYRASSDSYFYSQTMFLGSNHVLYMDSTLPLPPIMYSITDIPPNLLIHFQVMDM